MILSKNCQAPPQRATKLRLFRFLQFFASILFLLATPLLAEEKPKILFIGDSIFAWNALSGNTVARNLERLIDAEITDNSVSAMPIGSGGNEGIFAQTQLGEWDWIVVNGGGNDILRGCKCGDCRATLNRLINVNGTGGIIKTELQKLTRRGSKVLFVGYLRTNGFASPIPQCGRWINALEERVIGLSASTEGIFFMSNTELVPTGDRSFHDFDRIHPSRKGSKAIAAGIADVLEHPNPPAVSKNRASP